MKKQIIILCALSLFLLFQCSKDDAIINPPEPAEDFNTTVKALSYLAQSVEIDPPEEIAIVSEDANDGNYTCNVKRYKAAPGFNELALMDPTTDVIFPGAMIKGGSITTGEYIPIIADRTPINISVSLQNINGNPSRTVENPSLSSVRTAINEILQSDVTGATPANISFTVEEVHSEEQFNLAVGANYKTPFTKVSGAFDFNNESKKSRIVVKFLQIYYTLDVDPKAQPEDFFNTNPNTQIFGSVSPLYVSTITYGRMALFTFESEYSSTEMKAAINAAFTTGINDGEINVESGYQKRIETSTMKAVIFGGAGSSGVKAINGIEGLKEYILEGGDYSKDSPGAPLSYKMRYLKDNSVAKIILSSEYNVRNCSAASTYKIFLKEIDGTNAKDGDGSNPELYGWIKYNINGNLETEKYLWNVSEGNAKTDLVLTFDETSSINVTIEDQTDYIKISGHLKEYDPTIFDANEDLGESSMNIYLDELTEEDYNITFSGDGQSATATISISPVFSESN